MVVDAILERSRWCWIERPSSERHVAIPRVPGCQGWSSPRRQTGLGVPDSLTLSPLSPLSPPNVIGHTAAHTRSNVYGGLDMDLDEFKDCIEPGQRSTHSPEVHPSRP